MVIAAAVDLSVLSRICSAFGNMFVRMPLSGIGRHVIKLQGYNEVEQITHLVSNDMVSYLLSKKGLDNTIIPIQYSLLAKLVKKNTIFATKLDSLLAKLNKKIRISLLKSCGCHKFVVPLQRSICLSCPVFET